MVESARSDVVKLASATKDSSSVSNSSSSLLSRIISGSVGSIIYALVGTPIEVVKVRQQAAPSDDSFSLSIQRKSKPIKKHLRSRGTIMLYDGAMLPTNAFPCFAAPGVRHSLPPCDHSICSRLFESTMHQEQPIGTFRMLKSLFRNEGLPGLYAGLKPTLLMSVPNTVIYLSSYDEISWRLRELHSSNSDGFDSSRLDYTPLVAGPTARIISSFITAPLELIRTRQAASMIAGRNVHQGVLEEFHFLLRRGSIMSLYKGLGPLLLRDAPFAAIYFLCFENFKRNLSDTTTFGIQTPASVDVMQTFASGAGAALVATAFTGPFDVVKTRRQAPNQASGSNLNTFSYMRQIFCDEGISGLWKGNTSRMIKVVPGHAIMMTCYLFGKKAFDDLLYSVN